jgi:hypothetical protein
MKNCVFILVTFRYAMLMGKHWVKSDCEMSFSLFTLFGLSEVFRRLSTLSLVDEKNKLV